MVSRRSVLATLALPILRGQDTQANMFGDAESYERFMGRWSRLLAPLLVDFANVPDTGGVLDVGTGTGCLAFAIAERKTRSHVLGIDPAKEYVAYANSKNQFRERVRFEVGDAQELRFPDATFVAGLSLLVFNFIPDAGKALGEIRRVTKPRGAISAAVWDYPAGMRMLRTFWDAVVNIDPAADKLDEKHMPLCRAGELSKLWKRGGLENIHEQPLEISMRFASFADYWDAFLLGQGPAGSYVGSLPPDKLHALRNEVKRRLPLSGDDVPFVLPARAWAVSGTVPRH